MINHSVCGGGYRAQHSAAATPACHHPVACGTRGCMRAPTWHGDGPHVAPVHNRALERGARHAREARLARSARAVLQHCGHAVDDGLQVGDVGGAGCACVCRADGGGGASTCCIIVLLRQAGPCATTHTATAQQSPWAGECACLGMDGVWIVAMVVVFSALTWLACH